MQTYETEITNMVSRWGYVLKGVALALALLSSSQHMASLYGSMYASALRLCLTRGPQKAESSGHRSSKAVCQNKTFPLRFPLPKVFFLSELIKIFLL